MRIVQDEWATRLGVSRMPIRDAVSSLAVEGLVTVSSTNETVVASLTEEDVRDAYLLNALVTGIAAERTANRITDAGLERLAGIHAAQTDATERQDIRGAETFNWQFHRELNRACASPRLIAFMRVLSAGIPHFAIREIPSWRRQALVDHAALLEALRARDGKRARNAMEEHVSSISRLVIAHLREQGLWAEQVDGPAAAESLDGSSPD